MFVLLRRFLMSMLKREQNASLEPVRPLTTPDAERMAELERLRKEITFKPVRGFIHERFHQ